MRSLTELRGKPTVLVLCHPVKSATNDNLLPRGGSAFFGEIDGNLCARKNDSAVELHWFGKIRGMDFAPIAFRLDTVVADSLEDARGRKMPTVLATPIDDAGKQVLAATERSDQDRVLRAVFERPGESSNEIAKHLSWAMRDGKPYGVRVRRATERMAGDGLLTKHRGEWVLSARGEKQLNNLDRKIAVPSGTSDVPVLPPFSFAKCTLKPVPEQLCFKLFRTMQKPYRMGGTSVPILVPNSCRRGGIHALARVWNRTLYSRGCSVVPVSLNGHMKIRP